MARRFEVPEFYNSNLIKSVKDYRAIGDPRRKDLSPTILDFGLVQIKVARFFGFCFGVENAIEIAYRAIEENPGKRIFLLSEMIHNPAVNDDLLSRGVRFLMDTSGEELIPFGDLQPDDVVIIPAFGTTKEIHTRLLERGIDPYRQDSTCPFVKKVWKRSEELGRAGFSVIIHGKRMHEETRATFSHSQLATPTLVILNEDDAHFIADYIVGKSTRDQFFSRFGNCISLGYDPDIHLKCLGVVNQTTMLASETKTIAGIIRKAIIETFGEENLREHFADTRDTLCYATNENQEATKSLIDSGADLAVVVGGYKSSNTSHLVELCREAMPTYYIQDSSEILGEKLIRHFDIETKTLKTTSDWLPHKPESTQSVIALTSGASCPDATVDQVINKIVSLYTHRE